MARTRRSAKRPAAKTVSSKKYDNVVRNEYKSKPKGKYQIVASVRCKAKGMPAQTIKVGDYHNAKDIKEKLNDLRINAKAKYGGIFSIDSDLVRVRVYYRSVKYVKIVKRRTQGVYYRDAKGRFISYKDVRE